jgi:hypothetical protein
VDGIIYYKIYGILKRRFEKFFRGVNKEGKFEKY